MSEEQIAKIMEKLGYLTGMSESMGKKLDDLCEAKISEEGRIASLEKWQANVSGRVAVYSLIGGIIVSLFTIVAKVLIDKWIV